MGKLVLVPTPIGNLEDITLRALEWLKKCDAVLAEDTRNSSVLLNHFGIKNRLIPFHQHNEHRVVLKMAERMEAGETFALISDAGTPGISDPGFLLVRECLKRNIEVETLPGAVAFIPALINSGISCNTFCFEGFLPHKKGRNKRVEQLSEETRTMVFYESPYRLLKLLKELAECFGDQRPASVSRELSKMHEETVRGSLRSLIDHFTTTGVRGEIVVVVSGKNYP